MRRYYNERTGQQGEGPKWTLAEAAEHISESFRFFEGKGYFQRSFGYACVDRRDDVPGRLGTSLNSRFYLKTTIRADGRFDAFIASADEVALFTAIEFLWDHIAKPFKQAGYHHDYNGCGWHFDPDSRHWDIAGGKGEWRDRVNETLHLYADGFELSSEGEVQRLAPDGLADLVQAEPPAQESVANVDRITRAVRMFRRGRSTRAEQKQAVEELYGVLEYYRRQVKQHLLKKDEDALFMIANNYAIRHHSELQKDDYSDVWLSWLFFLYLSSVHLMLALIHGTAISFPADLPPPPDSVDSGPSNYDPNNDIPF